MSGTHPFLKDKVTSHFEAVLGVLSDAVLVFDENAKIIYINASALELLGFKTSIVGMSVSSIVEKFEYFSEDGQPVDFSELPRKKALQGGKTTRTLKLVNRDTGNEFWVQTTVQQVFDSAGEGKYGIAVFRDITKEKLAQNTLSHTEMHQEFLNCASEILASTFNQKDALIRIADCAVKMLNDWAFIDLYNGGELVRVHVARREDQDHALENDLRFLFPKERQFGKKILERFASGKIFVLHPAEKEGLLELYRDESYAEALVKTKPTSLMVLAIRVKDSIVGTMTVLNTESGVKHGPACIGTAEELLRRIAVSAERLEMFEKIRQTAVKEHEQAALLNTLLSKAPVGFALVDTQMKYLRVNENLAEINGISTEEHLGKTVREIAPGLADGAEPLISQVIYTGSPVLDSEVVGETKAEPGKKRHLLTSYYPVVTDGGVLLGVGIIVNEITRRKEVEERMHHQAFHDAMTGLPNRKHFDEYFTRTLHKAKRSGEKFAILFIDIDRLKDINDTLGHHIGDALLKEIGSRIYAILRKEDMLARWGGDEFVILATNILVSSDVTKIAGKILEAVSPVIRVDNHNLHMTASIGVAVYPTDGENIGNLLKNADSALYRAKLGGKNRFELYNQYMNINAPQRLALENDLRQALERGELDIHYQPILNVKSGKIDSVEALLRWNHSRLGLIMPSKFIPVAEDLGLMAKIGKWVLNTATMHMRELHDAGSFLAVSVNTSARQFAENNLAGEVASALEGSGIGGKYLEMEVTESIAMENLEMTRNILKQIESLGVSIVVDDFGTGYSSLNYLKRFPISKLKIDKTFVRHCITDDQDTSIIKAVISMSKSLNLEVIAEGVDTEMQLNLLSSLGCEYVQGYFISRPMSFSQLKEYLPKKNNPSGTGHPSASLQINNPLP